MLLGDLPSIYASDDKGTGLTKTGQEPRELIVAFGE
jgi:hypothetical protein